jgi:uncharacterized repeat protein (TIGR03803 family)
MRKFFALATVCVAFLLCGVIVSHGQTLSTLVTFSGSNGIQPGYGSLLLASDGNFYGTTVSGGDNTTYCSDGAGFGCGTIFKVTPSGTLTTLHAFCAEVNCQDGITPTGGLVEGRNGHLYGTAETGGSGFLGTIFEITPSGKFDTLYNFCTQTNCPDGEFPYAGLILASNGNFYGTTTYGGAHGSGTVFSITPAGVLSTLYNFCSQTDCTDGNFVTERLVEASNGKLYGTTNSGGANNAGTVFAITLAGKFTTLHTFAFNDGANPYGGLVQASNGNLVGTTAYGGIRNDGTIFEMTLGGALKTVYSFCVAKYCTDGASPIGSLLRGTDGNLYGTTSSGGAESRGTVFEVTPAGKLTTLYSFCSESGCVDGEYPNAGLTQNSGGVLYGTTSEGGDISCNAPYGCGTVFSLVK